MATSAQSYDHTAEQIINKAIGSVIFIDDELAEPFSDTEGKERALSKGLYDSFSANHCSLFFYKFRDLAGWKGGAMSKLGSKDLLILDWQLTEKGLAYIPAVEIISEAVKAKNLHFVCIYTEAGNFADIIYKINCYLSPFKRETLERDLKTIADLMDQEGFSIDKVFNERVKGKMREMVIYKDQAGNILNEIKGLIEEHGNKELLNQINNFFFTKVRSGDYKNLIHCYCGLGISLIGEKVSSGDGIAPEIRNFAHDDFLIVDHTIIAITGKQQVNSKHLYSRFKEAVIRHSGNFLTMMGLEMRNLFKDSSGFIGKDIDAINELAFFHHKEKSVPPEEFYDFLRELWKNQASSFLYDGHRQPKIFDSLDDYKATRGIAEKMEAFLHTPDEYQQNLGWLNYYYNILKFSRKKDDRLKFGDIFRIYNGQTKTDDYLLSITAHCDCLYSSEKIHDLFYFVKGKKGNLVQALDKGDSGFSSYILNEGKVEVIDWTDKPFTVYIDLGNNFLSKDIPIILGKDQRIIKYHSTLKGNYTQRVANNAFTYPMHVGIFFADTKGIDKKNKAL